LKILVTVGTTPFDNLFEFVDRTLDPNQFDVTCQVAEGKYTPKNHKSFKFKDDINFYYENSDIVITHAGAGTIYNLLEMRKKLIVCPNISRVDDHQLQISEYVAMKNYALYCHDLNDLASFCQEKCFSDIIEYKKTNFFGAKVLFTDI
jgi:beta-1,4-N-acetylglucosaminyltransferase